MSIHAGLNVLRNREKRNTLGYLECLVSIYLHNKIQPILFPFLHRLVWLLNPKPHPPLDGCQSEPQARGELNCVWSVPIQVGLSFFSSPVLWFACFVFVVLDFFPLIFFPPSFYIWFSWFGVFFTYVFTLHLITLGCDPKFGSVCYWNINNSALLLGYAVRLESATLLCLWALPIARLLFFLPESDTVYHTNTPSKIMNSSSIAKKYSCANGESISYRSEIVL